MVLEILTYPDERLRAECEDIEDFTSPAFQSFVDDLIETMQASPYCVGIAAPQVGKAIQMVVMDAGAARKPIPNHHGLLVMCNPLILEWSGMEVGREGCLSLPDYTGNVMRALDVAVQFQDRHGNEHAASFKGFEARIAQHEMDHLEGKLFIDRFVSRKADLFRRKRFKKK